jgi:DNA-binding NarL/FixJ family response regulator
MSDLISEAAQAVGPHVGAIGVVGASPLILEGLRGALAEIGLDAMTSVEAVTVDAPMRLLVLFVGRARHVEQLRVVLAQRPMLPVIAVVPNDLWCRLVLDAGASAVLMITTSPRGFALVIDCCLQGLPVLPTALATALMRSEPQMSPTWEELCMLDGLVRGEPVRALADRLGYSERHLHRRLKATYAKLRVRNRHEAIDAAIQLGWIPPGGEI